MQSIFRSASRRERLGKHLDGGRRGGELKIDWTKPLPRAWPMCFVCQLDLWQGLKKPEAVGCLVDRIACWASRRLSRRRRTRSVPWKMFAMRRVAVLLLSLGSGQACPPQFDLHPKTVLSIMRYP